VGENGHSSEGVLESIEKTSTVLREISRSIFPGELGERDHDVQVVEYKLVVEVGKPQEGLDVLYLLRFRPVGDGLDLVWSHVTTMPNSGSYPVTPVASQHCSSTLDLCTSLQSRTRTYPSAKCDPLH